MSWRAYVGAYFAAFFGAVGPFVPDADAGTLTKQNELKGSLTPSPTNTLNGTLSKRPT